MEFFQKSIHMASSHLPNYLRANRKRLGVSQDDVACLLGARSGGKVCRYERGAREPSLRVALAYETIFKRPIRELFAGLHDEVKREVTAHAKRMMRKIDPAKAGNQSARKSESLAAIAKGKRVKPKAP